MLDRGGYDSYGQFPGNEGGDSSGVGIIQGVAAEHRRAAVMATVVRKAGDAMRTGVIGPAARPGALR
jgi:hypothetical protein